MHPERPGPLSLRGRGWGEDSLPPPNRRQRLVKGQQHVVVGEADDAPAEFGEVGGAGGVGLGLMAVDVAVDLDREARLRHGEVEDERADRVLAAHLQSLVAAVADGVPEHRLGRRHRLPQFPGRWHGGSLPAHRGLLVARVPHPNPPRLGRGRWRGALPRCRSLRFPHPRPLSPGGEERQCATRCRSAVPHPRPLSPAEERRGAPTVPFAVVPSPPPSPGGERRRGALPGCSLCSLTPVSPQRGRGDKGGVGCCSSPLGCARLRAFVPPLPPPGERGVGG